ncbi:MAG: LLM class flavin-dependent oxidoreductase [Actinomycetota bacterium]
MKIGLSLLTEHRYGWSQLRDAAMSVEDVGFDSLWVPDHIERPFDDATMSMYEAVSLLGAIAECTERVSFGAAVHNAAWRHPLHLVHMAVALAEISGGRFVLAVGAGGRHYEYSFVDAPVDHPYSRFVEAIEIMRALLDGETVTYEGRFWRTFEGRVAGVEDHAIPLTIAANGRKSIDLAFRLGDEWNVVDLSGTPDASMLADRITSADAAAMSSGREIARSVDLLVSPVPMPVMPEVPVITGSPGEMIEALGRFAEAGFDAVNCYGPSPAEVGATAWQQIVDAVHAL